MDDVEVVIDPKDIELTTARSGGAGGMNLQNWKNKYSYSDLLFHASFSGGKKKGMKNPH